LWHVAHGEHRFKLQSSVNIFTANFKITSLNPPDVPSFISTTEVLQPRFSIFSVHYKSPAKYLLHPTPVPARISTIIFCVFWDLLDQHNLISSSNSNLSLPRQLHLAISVISASLLSDNYFASSILAIITYSSRFQPMLSKFILLIQLHALLIRDYIRLDDQIKSHRNVVLLFEVYLTW
jgi:hypothetical protein